MALTCRLNPDESAEPRWYCSSQTHHPRNPQLWVTRHMRHVGVGGKPPCGNLWFPSLLICFIFSKWDPQCDANQLWSMSVKRWWHKTKTAHSISISHRFLLNICPDFVSPFAFSSFVNTGTSSFLCSHWMSEQPTFPSILLHIYLTSNIMHTVYSIPFSNRFQ